MTAIRTLWIREVRAWRGSLAGILPVAVFLAVEGWTFVWMLRRCEGSVLQAHSIWGISVAAWLPVLGSLVTVRSFSEERAKGMIDLMMSAPVRERDWVIGKFLGAMMIVWIALTLTLCVPVLVLPSLSVPIYETFRFTPFLITGAMLLFQSAVWCAIGTMISICFANPVAAAVVSLVVCGGVPVMVYVVILFWVPALRQSMAWMPMLSQVYDFSTGLFSSFVLILYMVLTTLCLFVGSKVLAGLRLKN